MDPLCCGIHKLGQSVVTFQVTPASATVALYDRDGAVLSANSDGSYTLIRGTGYDYTYVVSLSGYVTKRGTLTKTELTNAQTALPISLDKAAQGDLPSYTGDWTSFRASNEVSVAVR